MRVRALGILAAVIALTGLGAASCGLEPAYASMQHSRPDHIRWPYEGKTCFEGPYNKDHAKPGNACWAGGICLNPKKAIFWYQDSGVWCMGQRRKDPKHPADGLVVSLRNEATKDHEYFFADLVGYVTYDPGNPIPGHAFWPFRNPHLDYIYDTMPVIQFVFVPGGKVTHSIRIQCINDGSLDANKPAAFGRCGPEKQFGHDLHDSYFVWPAPQHRIEAVHLTNTEQHKSTVYCLFADDPAIAPSPWYVRLAHAQGPVDLVGVFQFWEERKIHV